MLACTLLGILAVKQIHFSEGRREVNDSVYCLVKVIRVMKKEE